MAHLRTPLALATSLLVSAVVAAGCGDVPTGSASSAASSSAASGSGGGAAAPVSAKPVVSIKSYEFHPASVTVAVGGAVTFTNQDSDQHTATAKNAADQRFFDTDGLSRGRSRTVTFKDAGTYAYYCAYHPFMKGTVTVE